MKVVSVTTPLLGLRRMKKFIGNGQRLLEISRFDIPAGSCTLLSGANGAGKTTLLKIVAGLVPPDVGEIEYEGVSRSWQEARRHYARHVIYLHQQPYLFDRSVAANVAYGLQGSGVSRAEIGRRVDEALRDARLDHLATRNARELSGGEQQRVALTRALVLAPKLLLLDEPLASLDEAARERTCDLLRQLKVLGIALILTSHEKLSLNALADYHFELEDGGLTPVHPGQRAGRRAARANVIQLDDAAVHRSAVDNLKGRNFDDRH